MIILFDLPEDQARFVLDQIKGHRIPGQETDELAVNTYCCLLVRVTLGKEMKAVERKRQRDIAKAASHG